MVEKFIHFGWYSFNMLVQSLHDIKVDQINQNHLEIDNIWLIMCLMEVVHMFDNIYLFLLNNNLLYYHDECYRYFGLMLDRAILGQRSYKFIQVYINFMSEMFDKTSLI